jgi:hypothetical protein
VVYLVIGLDAGTWAGWHRNVLATDVTMAVQRARFGAAAEGIDLIVAAVVGPHSSVVASAGDGIPNAARATPRRNHASQRSRSAHPDGRRDVR